jgi:adenylosuccinate lyase
MREVLGSSSGLVYSQRVLLGLVEAGVSREDAYAVVQENAMRAWETGTPLRELLAADRRASSLLSDVQLDELFDPSWHTRHLERVMERVAAL